MGNVLCCLGSSLYLNSRSLHITPLTQGGFSILYIAQDDATREVFVLKRMTCMDTDTVKEALREVEIYGLFDHPNIIKCVDSSVTTCPSDPSAKDVYMLLPYYRRGSLQDLIDINKEKGLSLSQNEILDITLGICQGLYQLHHYTPESSDTPVPLAHRDIKPANILLADDNSPILMDFGSVANAVVRIENRQQALLLQDLAAERCTMPYRAPELFDVKSQCVVDEKVDIWSLGCTIYAMAFGISPFEFALTEQGGSIALAVINGNVSFPNTQRFSKDFRDFIAWLLQVDPQKRPNIDAVLTRINELRSQSQ